MPILYLDEDMKIEVADLLIAPDRSVRTTRGEGRLRAGDPFQLLYAAERDWTLVTCNREDYHLIHDAWLLWAHHWGLTRMHAGILTLDQGHFTETIVAAVDSFFGGDFSPLRNTVYDWSARDGVWRKYHP
jgi:hypothetical protein